MRPIDAEPIERELFRQADKALAKNPYANARVCAFRRALELILDAPTIESPPNDAPPNDPLTLEELREMDGQPVWIRNHCSDAYACRVIRLSDVHFTYFTDGGLLENRSYGSYWTAYRRKPEEGMIWAEER